MNNKSSNIVWHQTKITKVDRQRLNGHKSCVLWFTGLSGSGKSTLANEIEKVLYRNGIRTYILDGDNIRYGLNKDLDFSPNDRTENIRRIGEVSKLFVDAGLFVLSAFISPYKKDRNMVRQLFERREFIEIHVKCSLKECEKRDPKGLYKKAKSGEIKHFTGISAPYEDPIIPEIVVETEKCSVEESVNKVIKYLISNGYLNKDYYDKVHNNG